MRWVARRNEVTYCDWVSPCGRLRCSDRLEKNEENAQKHRLTTEWLAHDKNHLAFSTEHIAAFRTDSFADSCSRACRIVWASERLRVP